MNNAPQFGFEHMNGSFCACFDRFLHSGQLYKQAVACAQSNSLV